VPCCILVCGSAFRTGPEEEAASCCTTLCGGGFRTGWEDEAASCFTLFCGNGDGFRPGLEDEAALGCTLFCADGFRTGLEEAAASRCTLFCGDGFRTVGAVDRVFSRDILIGGTVGLVALAPSLDTLFGGGSCCRADGSEVDRCNEGGFFPGGAPPVPRTAE
jgi:hypothetical protein